MEPFYLLHFTYGMDYTRKGVFTPGKYGEWRFDKRTYAQLPPPRHLSEPPRGMRNALVSFCSTRWNIGLDAPSQSHVAVCQHVRVRHGSRQVVPVCHLQVRHLVNAINEVSTVIPGWDGKNPVPLAPWDVLFHQSCCAFVPTAHHLQAGT